MSLRRFPNLSFSNASAFCLQSRDLQLLILTYQAMHAGVIRDVEQQRIKKERQLDFELQKAMEEEFKKVQSVHDGGTVVEKRA